MKMQLIKRVLSPIALATAMIFAAGMGTRLLPLTETKPKALVEIGGVPMLEIIIGRLKKYGFHEIVINVHHFAHQIVEFLDKNLILKYIF